MGSRKLRQIKFKAWKAYKQGEAEARTLAGQALKAVEFAEEALEQGEEKLAEEWVLEAISILEELGEVIR